MQPDFPRLVDARRRLREPDTEKPEGPSGPKYRSRYVRELLREVKRQHLTGEAEKSWPEAKRVASKAKRTAFRS